VIRGEDEESFDRLLDPWQKRDFLAIDESWRVLAGVGKESEGGCWRAYLERPRGHSKTSDLAAGIAWILEFGKYKLEGIAAAADRDQGDLIRESVLRLAKLNPGLCRNLEFKQFGITNRRTGSRLTVISSDVQSSWGVLPDFVICDEVCHWEKADLWYSLLSSAGKKRRCLLAVLTNAGVGRGWQWDLREMARTSSEWHFSALEGCQASWIGEEQLAEQKQLLPPGVYERLWENRWQETGGEFVSLDEARACCDLGLIYQEQGARGCEYVAAVDFAEKRDNTVGVVIHRDGERVIVDRMDVVCPREGEPTRLAWVDEWIDEVGRKFPGVRFVVDEYQLLGTIQRLETRWPIRRFEFRGGKGNHALALRLRQLISQREIAWYPGCGTAEKKTEFGATEFVGVERDVRDDLETELASVILKQCGNGRLRIDHRQDGVHHDDRVFALGAACLELGAETKGGEWMSVSEPSEGMFFEEF